MPTPNAAHSRVLNAAVIGAGRMGRHHARIYRQLPTANLLTVVDPDLAAAQRLAEEFNCRALADIDQLLALAEPLHAASIATPTVTHRAIAETLAPHGVHLLIEKPLAPNLADAEAIVELARRNNCVLQVGHSERFNPVVLALRQYPLAPQFIEVTRISPMTFRSIDIGVVLDMMIHDIDIVHHLVRSPVKSVAAVGVNVIGKYEDVANVRLGFANGCVANLTASRLALKTERRMRLFSPDCYVSADYQKKAGVVIRRTANEAELEMVRAKMAANETADLSQIDYTKLVNYEELAVEDREPLRMELESFLNSILTGAEPEVTGSDGCSAVDIAMRITESIAEHQWQINQHRAKQ